MKRTVIFSEEEELLLSNLCKKEHTTNFSQVIRKAVWHYNNLLGNTEEAGFVSTVTSEQSLTSPNLPELTQEIIQSQLMRFPKVSPEQYRNIIRHLLMLQERGELKNAEATAYGLCKRIQAGRPLPALPDGSAAEPTEPARQQPPQGAQDNQHQELSTNDPRHPLYIALHPFAPLPKRQANQG